jgi:two-component system chemotaxis sensor kinase CheA
LFEPAHPNMNQPDEALTEFLIESHENLDQLDRDFLALESNPSAAERMSSIFRTIHTLKGSAGFLGLSRLERLAHSGESLLSLLRDGLLTLTPEMTSALLAMVDCVRALLRGIEETGAELEIDASDVQARLEKLRGPQSARPAPAAQPLQFFSSPPAVPTVPTVPRVEDAAPALAPLPKTNHAPPPEPKPVDVAPRPVNAAPPAAAVGSDSPPRPVDAQREAQSGGSAVADSSVRVDVGLLDRLMNLVGELVLARNQMVEFGARIEDPEFVGASQRLNHITTELQQQVMKTRMQPIGNVWTKLPRVVRDLAITCGKQIRIEMIGKETELDRTILEAIKDPLTHIVRNAVDHGIEAPDARAARGKPRTGTLSLKAFHEGGQVNIEIADDGGGLNLDAIRRKAIERNLVTQERAARLSPHELMQMIFVPGFSTAAQVTSVSGRGVGMDVVKTNIERIGGTVDISSTAGSGTNMRIKIPLTLAIVPALMVEVAGQRYAIPQVNLLELVRLESEQARASVERIHGVRVYRLRGRLLPLVFLGEQLRAGPRSSEDESINIVVLQADDRQFGLIVDEVRDTEEIVVKPLGKELKGISVFQGATILGDGRVALILDIMGLAQHAGAVGRGRAATLVGRGGAAGGPSQARQEEQQAWLLFGVGENAMALPLSMVARIEEFPRTRLERAGGQTVIQYRREILPLILLDEALGLGDGATPESLQVIVYSERGRSVGFVVGRILDVVEDVVNVERCTAQRGVLGAAVIQGRVVDLLDVQGLIRAQQPGFFDARVA